MIAQLKQLAAWLRRFILWMLQMKELWITILPLVLIVWLILIHPLRITEPQIRITGLIIEVMGVSTVAIGLRETRKLFDRPSLKELFLRWLKEMPRWNIEPNVGHINIDMPMPTVSFFGTSSLPPSATLEEKVNELEKSLNQAHVLIYQTQQQVKEEAQKQIEALELERHERERADVQTKKLLEEVTIGGLHLEAFGGFWIVLGIILSHASHEIERILLSFR
jgi:hypothetical protein